MNLFYFGSMPIGYPNGPGINEKDFLMDVASRDNVSLFAFGDIENTTSYNLKKNFVNVIKIKRIPILREFFHFIFFVYFIIFKKNNNKVVKVVLRIGRFPVFTLPLVYIARRKNIKCHVKTVGEGLASNHLKSIFGRFEFYIYDKIFSLVNSVDTPTQISKSLIEDIFPSLKNKVIIVENGACESFLYTSLDYNNKLIVLTYVGRFPEIRGGRQVINVLSELKTRNINAKAIITGSFDETANLRDMAKLLDIEEMIDFIGIVKPEDIPGILADSHFGFSVVEGKRGAAGQKLRQYALSGCFMIYQNDESLSGFDQDFIHEYENDDVAANFVIRNIDNIINRDSIRFWAKKFFVYSSVNEKRLNKIIETIN